MLFSWKKTKRKGQYSMTKKKKFIIAGVLLVAVIAGTIGGVALAQSGGPNGGGQGPDNNAMLERVAEIYEENTGTAIDAAELQTAMAQARDEIATEQREQMRQRLVDEGIITQEQLDELDAWLESRPDSMMTDEYKEWLESRPDIGLGPGNGEGFGRMHEGFGGQCGPGGGFRGPGGGFGGPRGGFGGPGGDSGGQGSGFNGGFQSGTDL
jgi:hypothetical protein